MIVGLQTHIICVIKMLSVKMIGTEWWKNKLVTSTKALCYFTPLIQDVVACMW